MTDSPTIPPEWVAAYVGIPFVDGGRTAAGLDCYGLVRLVLLEQFGIAVPSYHELYETTADREVIAQVMATHRAGQWRELAGPDSARIGDVALFRVAGLPVHCGLMVSSTHMLHVVAGCETVVQEAFGLVWARRLAGLYRYWDLS